MTVHFQNPTNLECTFFLEYSISIVCLSCTALSITSSILIY